ncbi:MAG: type II toxin-antitoxin system HicA family toxin [Gallionella sp.]|nr:type II toxin-antitoxin system HicA family toxin [Gallionella sp.]
MGSGYYVQLRKILLDHNCSFVRQGKGSHEIWRNPENDRNFPVAVTIISRHLANEILKQAGLKIKI